MPVKRTPRWGMVGWALAAWVLTGHAVAGEPYGAPVVLLLDRAGADSPFEGAVVEEVGALLGEDHRVVARSSGGNPLTAKALIEQAWAEPGVRVVVTVGPMSTALALGRAPYPKPTIALGVIEPRLQSAPLTEAGTTGVKNFGYLLAPTDLEQDLELLADIRPFRHLVVLGPPGMELMFPKARAFLRSKLSDPSIETTLLEVQGDGTHDALPPGVDAAYVLPLGHVSAAARQGLYGRLAAAGLPSVALIGRPEVELGAYASIAPVARVKAVARRAALDVVRALDGRDPATYPVKLGGYAPDLVFNMQTVRATGIYPPFTVMGAATLVGVATLPPETQLSLQAAVAEGLERNFGLRGDRLDVEIAVEDVRAARAGLLPAIDAKTQLVAIDQDRVDAAMGSQNQLTWSGSVELSQLVYADAAWANLAVQRLLAQAARHGVADAELDVVREVSRAYLGVLQAANLVRLQNDNVSVSKKNHDLAVARREAGGGSEADQHRWESQLALGKMDMLDAEVRLATARQTLNRLLARPIAAPIDARPMDLATVLATMLDPRVGALLSDAGVVARFSDFLAADSLRSAPALRRVDRGLDAQRRLAVARHRGIWTPTVALSGSLSKPFAGWGEAALARTEPSFDPAWNLGLVASIPLFAGLGNYAELDRARLTVTQLERDRDALVQGIEAQVRAGTTTVARRFAKIALAQQAAGSSRKNLEIVQRSYALGAAGVTQVIDSQGALLRAEVLAANSVYEFVDAYLDVERARGWFYFLATPAERDAFLARLETFMSKEDGR